MFWASVSGGKGPTVGNDGSVVTNQDWAEARTGLINRRSLENRIRLLRTEGVDSSFVMADLDHFKALNDANGHEAGEAMGRVREGLAHATGRGDTPSFTASFGVAHSSDAVDLDDLVQRADRALFAAKDAGRDRICIDGHSIPIARTLTAL
jgi:GGDEF domain-containing protein